MAARRRAEMVEALRHDIERERTTFGWTLTRCERCGVRLFEHDAERHGRRCQPPAPLLGVPADRSAHPADPEKAQPGQPQ